MKLGEHPFGGKEGVTTGTWLEVCVRGAARVIFSGVPYHRPSQRPAEGPHKGGSNVGTTPDTAAEALADAKWIWAGTDPRPVNAFALFRREFDIAAVPAKADLLIYSEWRYRLYVNGTMAMVGPTPCQPSHRLVDRVEVTAWLREGPNCLAIVVYTPGAMTGQWTLTNPALIASLVADGKPVLSTDASWKGIISTAWRHPTQFCGYAKGFHEWHVVADMPVGWADPDFDDSGWPDTTELPFYESGRLEENYVGYPTLTEHRPAALVGVSLADGVITDDMRNAAAGYYRATRNRWWRLMGRWHESRDNSDADEPVPEPIAERMSRETHAGMPGESWQKSDTPAGVPITIDVPPEGHPAVAFDFGVVRSGLIRVEIETDSAGTVDVGWDDRREDGRVAVFRSTPNADRVEIPAGRTQWTGFFERGLRYLQVTLRGFTGEVRIADACVVETLTPVRAAEPATFVSQNDTLNRIWRASAETARLYMTGCAAGDPVRERAHWLADDATAMRMAFVCLGEKATWRRALELTAEAQSTDGSLPVVSPGHFEDFNMVLGSCTWASSIAEYVRTTGDDAFGRRMLEHIRRHIAYELRFADRDGLLYETPGRRFLSWADGDPRTPYLPGETWQKRSRAGWGDFFDPPTRGWNAIINAYWLACLRDCAALAEALGHGSDSAAWRRVFESGMGAFHERFWEADAGLWRDNVTLGRDGETDPPTFCESTLFSILRAGLTTEERGLAAIARIMEPSFVCCRTSGGLEGGAYPTFLMDAGRTDDALAYWLDRWGAPVLAGATTCGEEFFRSGGNSDCHIHGAGPARDFIEYLAGIRIRGPRWKEVLLVPPAEGELLPDLRASVPTPHGKISTAIETAEGVRRFRWSLPEGITGYLRNPDGTEAPCSPVGAIGLRHRTT